MSVVHASRSRAFRMFASVAAVAAAVVGVGNTAHGGAMSLPGAAPALAAGTCNLGTAANPIQHVIYVQFDNTHYTRDTPNVPSDLEQMPHLLSFLKNNGVVLTNHHTPLISHTSEDILTALTGVYPNRHGVAVGQNSYQYYSGASPSSYTSAFTYWTDTIGNGTYNLLSAAPATAKSTGTNAPAPWVPFTRAGCNVGAVASANQVLENNNVNSKFGANDIGTVYGVNSPEAQETPAQRTTDFVGIAVHCSQADSGATGMCSSANHGRPDVLPDEPGGYSGFNALYGHKYVAPLISPGAPLTDLNGTAITDAGGHPGFPGFDAMSPAVSLGYVAAMQEHGVPVTYAYISDAHDAHNTSAHVALGSGEQAYEQQLQAYDQGFAKFFTRLQNDGITPHNSLFVFTSNEGDHFTAGPPLNPGCTGATVDNTQNPPVVTPGNYCQYNKTTTTPPTPPGPPFGEVATGLQGLLARQGFTGSAFTLGNDTAPAVYLDGQPTRTDPGARAFERAVGSIVVNDPLMPSPVPLAQYMADPVEMNILHMVTADPARTPTFTVFGQPDLYITGTCTGGFDSAATWAYTPNCVLEQPAYAWLHGNVQPDVSTTWLGMVGPGVQSRGVDSTTWSDHTDIRPTMMALTGLKDDYTHDGRVLYEDLTPSALPTGVAPEQATVLQLAQAYKQLEAPVGEFGLATLRLSTQALKSGSSTNDALYTSMEAHLTELAAARDRLAAQMIAALESVEFGGGTMDVGKTNAMLAQSTALLQQVGNEAGSHGFEVDWRSDLPGQGYVMFAPGTSCSSLVEVATADRGAGGAQHRVFVSGNDLPGTVGNTAIQPGDVYSYETVTVTSAGTTVGPCQTVSVPNA